MGKRAENKDELVLKWMLGQIKRARQRKKRLDDRLMEINAEHNSPIGGVGYKPLPRNGGISNGAASILFKLADIEERIYAQKTEIEKSIVRVMDILEYLPIDSLEREVCELHYIDGKKMTEIEYVIPMSRAQCYNKLNAAIAMLLTQPRIKTMVRKNTQAYDDWCYQRDNARERNRRKNKVGGSASEIISENSRMEQGRGIRPEKSTGKKENP